MCALGGGGPEASVPCHADLSAGRIECPQDTRASSPRPGGPRERARMLLHAFYALGTSAIFRLLEASRAGDRNAAGPLEGRGPADILQS